MDLNYRDIGVRIKKLRKEKKITQEHLASEADLSVSHISNIETGSTKLSLPTIVTIANILSVTVDELLAGNVINSRNVFNKEAQQLLEDCNEYETRVLVEVLKASKLSMRNNWKYLAS